MIGFALLALFVLEASAMEPMEPPQFEDTDGGFNFLIKGQGTDNDGKLFEDRCFDGAYPGGGQGVGLMEIACFKKRCYQFFIASTEDFSCQDGRFITASQMLSDTDGGENIFQKGVTLRKGEVLEGTTDSCENEKSVKEYFRGGSRIIQCPEGTVCSDGVCQGAQVSCKEVFSGLNKADQKRFNLVFVGSDYHLINRKNSQKGRDAFLWDIQAILGENTTQGFFDFEPFRSRRDLFNVWYIDRFNIMPAITEPYGFEEHQKRNAEAMGNVRVLAKKCQFDLNIKNVIPIHLVPNKGTLDSAITIATTRHVQLFNPTAYRTCQQAVKKTLRHMPDQDRDGCVDLVPPPVFSPMRDYNGDGKRADRQDRIFFDRLMALSSTMNLCRKEKNWHRLVEHLCASGIDNLGRTVDNGSTLAHEMGHRFSLVDIGVQSTTENPQWNGVTIGNCFIAGSKSACVSDAPWTSFLGNSCFEGCISGVTSFRPESVSTYTYGYALEPGSAGSHELGKWNEWYLKNVMQALLEL